ncbi:alpha/beta hydrolase, partial [Leptolyngbya sp. FACHB-36]|nr:alpha/beta hydrolase [Leptolyngbya sp. FACHB-36]
MSPSQIIPTVEQITQTKRAIDAYIRRIDSHPDRRVGAYPYYLFHEAGQAIRGTVMIFHGLSAKPHQMWRLADYLFRNGFNVYQPSIAGHTYINAAVNWAQIDLKPTIYDPLKAKVQQDPVLMTYFANLRNNPSMTQPSPVEQAALIARLIELEPRLPDIMQAIDAPNDPD